MNANATNAAPTDIATICFCIGSCAVASGACAHVRVNPDGVFFY